MKKLGKLFAFLACLSLSTCGIACGGADGDGNQQQGATQESSFSMGDGVEVESEGLESSSEIESSEDSSVVESEGADVSSEIGSEELETSSETESEGLENSSETETETETSSKDDKEEETLVLLYTLNQASDGYIVKGYTGTPTALVIPSMYENLPVTGIEINAFNNCDTLTSVCISDSVIKIAEAAFRNCDNLISIEIGAGVSVIERYAMYECPALTNIIVSESNETYQSIDGDLYSKDGKTLLQYAGGKTAISFTIPETVTAIGDDAFAYCGTLTDVVFHNKITNVGYWAFAYCTGLTKIVIPASVTTMRDYVFYGCSNLTIYCEVASKPFGWGKWNFTQCPVVWGSTGEE